MTNEELTPARREEILATWSGLNEALKELTEAQTKQLLDAEQAGKARTSFLQRIHARYNVLRGDRERKELYKSGGICGPT